MTEYAYSRNDPSISRETSMSTIVSTMSPASGAGVVCRAMRARTSGSIGTGSWGSGEGAPIVAGSRTDWRQERHTTADRPRHLPEGPVARGLHWPATRGGRLTGCEQRHLN